jgi:hypothetical protein
MNEVHGGDVMPQIWTAVAWMQQHPFETLVAAFSIAIVLAVAVILLTHQGQHMGDAQGRQMYEEYRKVRNRREK